MVPGNFQAVYFRDSGGRHPVDDFLTGLGLRRESLLKGQIDRLNGLGPAIPHLPFPHSSQVAGELRELRCHAGREQYRVLFRRSQNLIVLLHIFRKTTADIPPGEIVIAEARWAEFKARMDEHPRKPPRAAGRDAP
jgi:phage-related protein